MPEYYEIKIKGHLDPSWSDWFAGLKLTHLEGERDPAFRLAARPGRAPRPARAYPRSQPDLDLGYLWRSIHQDSNKK